MRRDEFQSRVPSHRQHLHKMRLGRAVVHSRGSSLSGSPSLIGADHSAASEASRRAFELGLGPRTYDYLAHRGVEIADFVEGRRACTIRDFRNRHVRATAISLYRAFNGSRRLGLTKTVFDMIEEHLDQLRRLDARLPAEFSAIHDQYLRARSALEASGLDLVPCYNDPAPANFLIADDRSILIVDYEYASNNDRCYDLAVWCGEMFFSYPTENEIIESYFGRVDPAIQARIFLYRRLGDLKWSAWAMIQNCMSPLDFDFFKFGALKQMRARAALQDPRWEHALKSL
ncbi:phosphotransferase [Mesorhizobium yinganensis]|uniref:phosphotransferase n=1 Tax=Mesorhizobium yinganensis TaxID=3157707 RepID=UPI0032B7FD34